jgi:acetyl esterase/lipase
MPLDPQAVRILGMLVAAGPANASHATVSERRHAFRKLMSLFESNEAIGHVEDRVLPGPDGSISIRIYTPIEARSDQLPGFVYFHGGGLVAGSLDTHEAICRMLANATGCRLVSVDYRLAPEHKFPAAVMDGYAAAIWTAENAAVLGIDGEKIVLGGDSAGGTLAAIVCQLTRQAQGVKFAAQLLLCPITDFGAETESRRAFAEGYLLDQATMDRDLEHYVPDNLDPADPRISPLRAANFSGLPPAYIHTAEFDPVRDEGRAYAQKLMRAGVEVNYTCHPGMIHLFYGMASVIPYARRAIKCIGAEIKAELA